MMKNTIAIYCLQSTSLNVLIPKRRGEGYCKSVFGFHSHNAACDKFEELKELHFKWFAGDTCDIDGYLQINVIIHSGDKKYKDGLRLTLAALKICFPFVTEFKEDSTAFWNYLIPNFKPQ